VDSMFYIGTLLLSYFVFPFLSVDSIMVVVWR